MNVTRFFVSHSRLAAVLAIVALLMGAMSVCLLPVTLYPTLARPAISVSCTYPGANAVEVMNTVAGPLEEKVNGVEGMNRMTSACHDNGSYSLTVNFEVGYDRDVALMKVQSKVQQAGLEIVEARITYLAYAPEIAAVMLQRQQASAIIDARKMIVDGAVGMVEMALERLGEGGMVQLDEERKAAMVSNLLVVLCGNRDAQPVVNSGSLY